MLAEQGPVLAQKGVQKGVDLEGGDRLALPVPHTRYRPQRERLDPQVVDLRLVRVHVDVLDALDEQRGPLKRQRG